MFDSMHASQQQVVLITGASSGIGLKCAEYLSAKGYRVYGTSRRAQKPNGRYEMLQMDVTSDHSVAHAISTIIQVESRLDVLVNNAGFAVAGAIEDTSQEEVQAQFDTNVFGPFRLCKAVLPHMRRQNSGLIVNMSSIAGLVPLPFQAMYSASKAALESVTESLRMEVSPFNIRVVLIEPGDFRTRFTENRVLTAATTNESVYRDRFERAIRMMELEEFNGWSPSLIAEQLEHIIKTKSPRLRYPIATLLQRSAPMIRQLLPQFMFESLLLKTYGIYHSRRPAYLKTQGHLKKLVLSFQKFWSY